MVANMVFNVLNANIRNTRTTFRVHLPSQHLIVQNQWLNYRIVIQTLGFQLKLIIKKTKEYLDMVNINFGKIVAANVYKYVT